MSQRLRPKGYLKWSQIGPELIILDSEAEEVLRLNGSAGFLWQRLDGRHSAEDLIDQLIGSFDIDRGQARKDVEQFLQNLLESEIVEVVS